MSANDPVKLQPESEPSQVTNDLSVPPPENTEISLIDAEEDLEDEDSAMSLPLSKIKKIAKMDPEFKAASNSAIYATGVATELFVQYLVEHATMQAKMEKRKKIQYKDLSTSVSAQDSLRFLADTIPKTQQVGKAIKENTINLTPEDQLKYGVDQEPEAIAEEKADAKKVPVLPKGQSTLNFEPIPKRPVKKAGLSNLMSNDENTDEMAVDAS